METSREQLARDSLHDHKTLLLQHKCIQKTQNNMNTSACKAYVPRTL